MRPPRWIALPAGLLAVATTVAVCFGPYVRREASSRALRYGALVEIDSVRPTWIGVRLQGVHVRFEDFPDSSLDLEELQVTTSAGGEVRSIVGSGANVRSTLSSDAVRSGLRTMMQRTASGKARTSGPRPELRLTNASIAWENGGQKFVGSGVGALRTPVGWQIDASELTAARGGESFTTRRSKVELEHLGSSWRLASLRTEAVSAVVTVATAGTTTERRASEGGAPLPGGASSAAPASSVLAKPGGQRPAVGSAKALLQPRGGGDKKGASAPSAAPPSAPGAASPALADRILAAKARLHQAAALLHGVMKPGSALEVGELSAEIQRGGERVHVGPGALRVASNDGVVSVSMMPTAGGGAASPLLVKADVPIDPSQGVSASLSGGPVTLAMLGMHDNELGLLDVAKTTVEAGGTVQLAGDGARLDIDLHGQLKGLSVAHPKLSSEAVRGLDLRFSVKGGGALDWSEVKLERGEIDLGAVHAELSGQLDRQPDGYALSAKYAVPLASCQGVIDAMPTGLMPKLAGVKMSGTFALNGRVVFESKRPLVSQVDFNLMNECRVTHAPPEIHVGRLRQPFRRKVYSPDGHRVEVDSGPGTAGWVSMGGISPFMEAAVLTTEDGGFRRHKGFDIEAIRNSIRENLKAGRFVRGASTISMQTAKNIYLERDKTLGRKLQEAFLTAYLEQEMGKAQIMELYLNSIEFGPMIYGVSAAAAHYFHTSASQLSLGQALYLASILPNPKQQHFGADGKVTASFMGYLHRLMRGMAKRNLIREDELQEGLQEWVQFGVPKPPKTEQIEGVDDAGAAGVDDAAQAPLRGGISPRQHHFWPCARRLAKNALRRAAQAAASTPLTTWSLWLRRGSSTIW
jgi:hypothetical protein